MRYFTGHINNRKKIGVSEVSQCVNYEIVEKRGRIVGSLKNLLCEAKSIHTIFSCVDLWIVTSSHDRMELQLFSLAT